MVNLNEAKTQILTITLPKAPAAATPPPAKAPSASTAPPGTSRWTQFTGYWIDPQTKLMWAIHDNGQDITWADANSYCKAQTTGNFTDWRLPRAIELKGISFNKAPKGNIKSTGIAWSGFKGSQPNTAAAFSFLTGDEISTPTGESKYYRALCVRGPVN